MTRISSLTELASPAAGDHLVLVDISDPTESGTGTTKRVTAGNLASYIASSTSSAYDVNVVAASGSTETLDTSAFPVHDVTMDTACTFTFSNPVAAGDATVFSLILRGAFTPTLPASVDWPDGTPPTYTTPSVYTFITRDGGTNWFGFQAGKAFA